MMELSNKLKLNNNYSASAGSKSQDENTETQELFKHREKKVISI